MILAPLQRYLLAASFTASLAILGLEPIVWAATSPGKIGPWVTVQADQKDQELSDFLRVCPAAALWELTSITPPKKLDSFATTCADSAIVLIPDTSTLAKFASTSSPQAAATSAWNAVQSFQTITHYGPNRFWIQGPTQDLLPSMNGAEGLTWQRNFWRTFGELTGNSGASLLIPTEKMTSDGLRAIAQEVEQLRGKTGFALSAATSEACVGPQSDVLSFRDTLHALRAITPAATFFLAPAELPRTASQDVAVNWLTWFDATLRHEDVLAALVRESPTAHIAFDTTGARLANIASATSPQEEDWSQLETCSEDSESDAGNGNDQKPDAGHSSTPGDAPLGSPTSGIGDSGCSATSSSSHGLSVILMILGWLGMRRRKNSANSFR